MSDGVAAVTGVEAVSLAMAASMSARETIERREKRLRWLASLRAANGEAAATDPEAAARREAAEREGDRERIAAALGTVEEFGRLGGAPGEPVDDRYRGTITAADLARRMRAQADMSLRVQAHLGAASVRRLVGEENATDGVNGL
jgi:hypothetical protein